MMDLCLKKIFTSLGVCIVSLLFVATNTNAQTLEMQAASKNSSKCPIGLLIQNKNILFLGHSVGFEIGQVAKVETHSKEDSCTYDTTLLNLAHSKAFDINSFSFEKTIKRSACQNARENGVVEHHLSRSGNTINYKNIYYQADKKSKKSEFECIYTK